MRDRELKRTSDLRCAGVVSPDELSVVLYDPYDMELIWIIKFPEVPTHSGHISHYPVKRDWIETKPWIEHIVELVIRIKTTECLIHNVYVAVSKPVFGVPSITFVKKGAEIAEFWI
jgi:hypothetical protein